MKKDTIVYIDDEAYVAYTAEERLKMDFPDYSFVHSSGHPPCVRMILEEVNLDRIAVICADGHLPAHTWGWDVVEELKQKGYCGPTVYIGGTTLPEEKKHLFSDVADKFGDKLIETLRKYI